MKKPLPDLADVRGQRQARRALEIAAAGGHNLLLISPPGSGKTTLARRLPSIMPPLSLEEQVEVTRIWSAAGLLKDEAGLATERPFRALHHTVSEAGLIGGAVRPGEVSLAHLGVLFLDELPELSRRVLESLRRVVKDRELTVAQAVRTLSLPADFMLVGAMNPCPCGWLGTTRSCACTPAPYGRYLDRVPYDLFDMVVQMEERDLAYEGLDMHPESSATVRERVVHARARLAGNAVAGDARTRVAHTIAALAGHDEADEDDLSDADGQTCASRVSARTAATATATATVTIAGRSRS